MIWKFNVMGKQILKIPEVEVIWYKFYILFRTFNFYACSFSFRPIPDINTVA